MLPTSPKARAVFSSKFSRVKHNGEKIALKMMSFCETKCETKREAIVVVVVVVVLFVLARRAWKKNRHHVRSIDASNVGVLLLLLGALCLFSDYASKQKEQNQGGVFQSAKAGEDRRCRRRARMREGRERWKRDKGSQPRER